MTLAMWMLPVVLPVLFWAGYHYWVDRHLPEPKIALLAAFLLGVGAYYLGLEMYRALDLVGLRRDALVLADSNRAGLFIYAIAVIGLIEELAKMIPFLLFVIRFRSFDEPIDGIIYGSFIALGFAAVENYHYSQWLSGPAGAARGFAGPVVHMVFASIWGYYIGRAWLCERSIIGVSLAALAVTAVLHGLYDFVVIALPPPALPVAALLVAGLWIWRLCLIKDLHAAPPGRCP